MIAPARVAAYEILLAVSAGRADLPSAIARARASLADERDRALAAEIATGVQRWRAALDSPHRPLREAADRAARPGDRRDPAPQRLSAAAPLARAGVGGGRRCGGSGAAGGQAERGRIRQRGAADDFAAAERAAAPAEARAIQRIATQALDYLSITLSHPAWLAARWFDRLGFDGAEAWMQFNNAPAPLTLRANRLRMPPDELVSRLRERGVVAAPGRFAPDALIVDGRPAAPGAGTGGRLVRRPGRSVAARGAARRTVAGPARARHLRLARRQDHGVRRRQSRTRLLVACDVRERRIALLQRTVAATGADERAARAGRPVARRFRSPTGSTACSSTRPARASARSGAIRTSGGGGTKRIWPHWPRRSSRCCVTPRRPWRLAAGSSTRPVRANRRRTNTWSRRFSRPFPGSRRSMRVRLTRHCRRTPSTIAATFGPSPIATVSRGSSGRSW